MLKITALLSFQVSNNCGGRVCGAGRRKRGEEAVLPLLEWEPGTSGSNVISFQKGRALVSFVSSSWNLNLN